MAANINKEVDIIASLRQKDNNVFGTPVYMATDQRFIKPIRGSSDKVKNFEEQSLIGTGSYTIQEINGDGDTVIEKSFVGNTNLINATKYYKLKTTIYKEPKRASGDVDFHFDDETHELILPKAGNDIQFNGTSLQCNSNNIFNFSETTLNIYPNYDVVTQTDELYFMKGETQSARILTKTTQKRYETKTKIITQETIIREGED